MTTRHMFAMRFDAAPVAQPRHRVGAGRGGFARAYIPASHAVHGYKHYVQWAAKRKWQRPPLEGPLACDVLFVAPCQRRGRWKETLPDLDNLLKSLWDALQGVVFRNDGQIARVAAAKRFRRAGEKPFVEIAIRKLCDEEQPPMRLVDDGL